MKNIKSREYYKNIDVEKIKHLYLHEKLSISQIAKQFDVSGNIIKNKLIESEISIRKRYSHKGYTIKENLFEHIDTEEKAYWLGMLFADGSLYNYKYGKSMQLELIDKEHIEKFRDFLGFTGGIKSKKGCSFCLRTCNYKICTDLIQLGCVPNKTYNLSYLPILDRTLIRHFIRGYFDGDGCITHFKRGNSLGANISFYGHKFFLETISFIFKKELGIACCFYQGKKYKDPTSSIMIGGNKQLYKILCYLYKDSNIYLERKYKKVCEFYKLYNHKKKLSSIEIPVNY